VKKDVETILRCAVLLCVVCVLAGCAGQALSTPEAPTPPPTQGAQATSTLAATEPLKATPTPIPTSTLPAPTATPTAGAAPADLTARAQTLAEQFLQGDYVAVVAQFDATMKSVFPAEKAKEAREALEAQVGEFRQFVGTRAEKYEQAGQVYDIVYVTIEFAKATIDFKVVYDQAGQVAGLFFQPAQATPTGEWAPPSYADTASFREQDVTVGSGDWALPGTLTLPAGSGPFPALVLVHGSGPNDRDETIGPNKPFKDLAWGLASRGIAVLRYEKRTRQHAAKFTEEVLAKLTAREETTDDALAAVALLRQTPGIDPARVYVLGHSLGGYLLPRIGAADPAIAGLVVLAGPTRPLEDVTLEQFTYLYGLDGAVTADEQASLDELAQQVARVKDPSLTAAARREGLPLGIPASFWLDVRSYNPAELAGELGQPMLVLQGARDYQVTAADFEGWQASLSSHPDVQLTLYPDLNHVFMAGEGKGTPAEYGVAGYVAEEVVQEIASWILATASSGAVPRPDPGHCGATPGQGVG
jgi:uncharacterized protein